MASRSRVLRWRKIPGPPADPTKARLLRLHVALERRFGPQPWRPARAPSEVAVGAVLARAGSPRVKARRLQAFTRWLAERFAGRLDRMRRAPLPALRREMLAIAGLGPETVDTILLCAAGRPVFVADAHARGVLARHGFVPRNATYEATRRFVEAHLPSDPALFSALHALLVAAGELERRSVVALTASPAAGRRSARRRPARPRRGRARPSP
jgi:endonuclease III-like uncharacterized protein